MAERSKTCPSEWGCPPRTDTRVLMLHVVGQGGGRVGRDASHHQWRVRLVVRRSALAMAATQVRLHV